MGMILLQVFMYVSYWISYNPDFSLNTKHLKCIGAISKLAWKLIVSNSNLQTGSKTHPLKHSKKYGHFHTPPNFDL